MVSARGSSVEDDPYCGGVRNGDQMVEATSVVVHPGWLDLQEWVV
uniref:Uncharacterized protein n=1 Tax=Romanomermis culicivorax TaxID=13658 RepID=A0A915HHI4_ROMCU